MQPFRFAPKDDQELGLELWSGRHWLMTRAFVAGATGYVGREVVRALRAKEIETTAHVRPSSSRVGEWTERFKSLGAAVDLSAWTREEFAKSLEAFQPDIVFSLLGTTRKRAKAESITGNAYEKIDYGLTALLFEVSSSLESNPRFVYLSAAGVGDKARSAYMAARVKSESMIRSGDLPYVFARPAVITGADRDESRPGERAMGTVLDGALSVAGLFGARKFRERYRSTTNTTLAAALVRLATESSEDAVVAEGTDLR